MRSIARPAGRLEPVNPRRKHGRLGAGRDRTGADRLCRGREALTNAGLLLCASRQLVIGTGIANIWARDPMAMAAAQRTLAEAYPGRFVLGIGVSHAPIVDARGHRYQRPLDRMRGYLDAMDAAPGRDRPWRSNRHGCWPRSAPHAGAGRGTIGRRPYLPQHARDDRLGRSIVGGRSLLAVEQAVLLEEDPAEARRIGREYIAFYLTLPNYVRAWERAGFGPEDLAAGGSDRLVDAMVAWGNPEAIAERVDAHLDAGADHVCLHALDADPNALPVGAWRTLAPALHAR